MWGKEKNNKLVATLQKDIVDSRVGISDILRKAKILAQLLKNDQFKRWVDSELKGYKSEDPLPDYRKFGAVNHGTFNGPFGKRVTNFQIPLSYLPDFVQQYAKDLTVWGGVRELESSIASAGKEYLRLPWPTELVQLSRSSVRMEDGCVLVEAWQVVTKSQLEGILDQVRTRLLDFLLELQQVDPDAMNSDDTIPQVASDRVQNIFQTTIQGGQNVVAVGPDLSQKVKQTIIAGNQQSLLSYFRHLGMKDDALNALAAALAKDGHRSHNQLGEAVQSWIGKMMAKAMDGTWKIALATAPQLLKEAFFKYYGWS